MNTYISIVTIKYQYRNVIVYLTGKGDIGSSHFKVLAKDIVVVTSFHAKYERQ